MIAAPPPALHFQAASGWRTGAGRAAGTYGYDAAWTASPGVVFRDPSTADPPNRTLAHLHGRQIVVFASLALGASLPPVPSLAHAKRFACCEGAVPGWPYLLELDRGRLIVRVYFGRAPDAALRAAAERRLRVLEARQ